MSHWSERPIVTVSWRIGYAFSTPDGALTMKFAETPSRSAGLIISVFGAASSRIALLAEDPELSWGRASVRGSAGAVKEHLSRHAPVRAWTAPSARRSWRVLTLLRSCPAALRRVALRAGLLLRLLFAGRRRGRVLRRRQLRQCGLEHRLTGRLCVLVIERHHDRLPLIDPREIPPLDECATVRVRVQLADLHRIAGRGDKPEPVSLARRRGGEAVCVQPQPGFPVGLFAPGRRAPSARGRFPALPDSRALQDDGGTPRVAQSRELRVHGRDLLLQLRQRLLVLLCRLLRLRELLVGLRVLGREVRDQCDRDHHEDRYGNAD